MQKFYMTARDLAGAPLFTLGQYPYLQVARVPHACPVQEVNVFRIS